MSKIWIGSPADIRQNQAAEKALQKVNDSKYWNDETGITQVPPERWNQAQQFESAGWLTHWRGASSDRNDEHKKAFNNYDTVPHELGNVIEIGCGPFTQLKTIQHGREIKEVTLLDPLLEEYLRLPHCTYKDRHFMDHPTTLRCCQAEELRGPLNIFDTVICINVLEHVQDVPQVLTRLERCLAPGGIVIFGERAYDKFDTAKVYDVGHPVRIKKIIITNFMKIFKTLFINTIKHEWGLNYHFIGRKKC